MRLLQRDDYRSLTPVFGRFDRVAGGVGGRHSPVGEPPSTRQPALQLHASSHLLDGAQAHMLSQMDADA